MTRKRDPLTIAEAQRVLGLSVPAAAKLAGVSEAKMYLACQRGEVASVRAFGRVLVCAVPFLAMFGVDSDVVNQAAEVSSSLGDSSVAQECRSHHRKGLK